MIEERYIIDTDPGDDIDDAFAITLAVKAKLDLVGIVIIMCADTGIKTYTLNDGF